MTDLVEAWAFDREVPWNLAQQAALVEAEPPDVKVLILGDRSDHLTLQLIAGEPSLPDGWMYVRGRGLFEIVRVERWPASASHRDRLLLTVRAYPMRGF